MSKLLSLAALAALALATFEANKDTEKVYATADGNIFLSENYARNHARQEKLEVYTITRAEALATETTAEGEEGNKGGTGEPNDKGNPTAPNTPDADNKAKAKTGATVTDTTTA